MEENFFQPYQRVRLLVGKKYDQRLFKINSLPNWKYREIFDYGTCAGRSQTINRQPQFNRFSRYVIELWKFSSKWPIGKLLNFNFRNREFPNECREVEYHNDENVILACPYSNRDSNRDCMDGVSIMYSTIKTCDITF